MKTNIGISKAIDELYRVRNEKKILESTESELVETIKTYMVDHEVRELEGKKAGAILTIREQRTIDPEAYFEAINGDVERLLASVNVRMDPDKKHDRAGAKSYLGEVDLKAISSVTYIPSLSVKKLAPVAKDDIVIPKAKKNMYV